MIPVNIVTGFLGSGKTTLLREVLQHPAFSDSAVIVNEFGEIGLDHLLLEKVDEGVLLMESGCICCTIRSDLKFAIRDLQDRAAKGEIPAFRRVIVETTGLADPVPIVSTILAEPVLRNHFRLANIVCTVDAVNGPSQLERQPESVKQVLVADRLLITKCDLATRSAIRVLSERLEGLNPTAARNCGFGSGFDVHALFTRDLGETDHRLEEVRRWMVGASPDIDGQGRAHAAGIHSFCLTWPHPMEWTAFGIWLTALLHAHGDRVLRVKGILNARDSLTPVVVHGVQHVMHPPLHLERWPDNDRRSRIVFITRDLPESSLKASLAAFMEQAAVVVAPVERPEDGLRNDGARICYAEGRPTDAH